MPDGRCGSCEHWSNPWTDDPDQPHNYGKHVPPQEDRPRWGTCTRVGMARDSSELGDLPAFVIDGSEYAADLHVRDDFGCVLFEAKDGAPARTREEVVAEMVAAGVLIECDTDMGTAGYMVNPWPREEGE